MTNKPQMTNMTAEQWDAIAEAVDALSGALSAVNPRLNPEPEPLAEWERVNYVRQSEPWPTADLIVWTVNGDRGLFSKNVFGDYVAVSNGQITSPQDHDNHENAVPVRPVPVAAFDALVEVLGRWNTSFGTEHREVAQLANRLAVAAEALGLDA